MNRIFLILSFFLVACNLNTGRMGQAFEIIKDLRSHYDIDTVEISWDLNSTTFVLDDFDYDELSIDELKDHTISINEYLSKRYLVVDTLEIRKYKFSRIGFEIVDFVINRKGEIVEVKEYK